MKKKGGKAMMAIDAFPIPFTDNLEELEEFD